MVLGSFSANREDVFVRKILGGNPTWYLDIGSGDPIVHSNTMLFYSQGARGVAVDANRLLVNKYEAKRPDDKALFGAVSDDRERPNVKFYELDPWELSTTNDEALQSAIANGAKVKSVTEVSVIDVDQLLVDHFPYNSKTFLNIDLEGISYKVLSAIDFERFPFSIVAVERDVMTSHATEATNLKGYRLALQRGPTDIWIRSVD